MMNSKIFAFLIASIWLASSAWGQAVAISFEELKARAERGEAAAQYSLGAAYTNGEGVTRSLQEAAKWFRLAAEQGDATAQYNLGVMYGTGQGVTQNYQESAKWFRLAAEQGYADAQYFLGYMYETGKGVLKSQIIAHALYNLAKAIGNHEESGVSLNRLAANMSAADIDAAQKLAAKMSKQGSLLKALDEYAKKNTASRR